MTIYVQKTALILRSSATKQTASRRERPVMALDGIVRNPNPTEWTKIMQIRGEAEFYGQYLDERDRFNQ